MPILRGRKKRYWPSSARLETLTDGIFAIAMTIMVLNIEVPGVPPGEAGPSFIELLGDLSAQLGDYAISFLLLATFWIVHHKQMRWVKRTDLAFTWINIFLLFMVTLVPLSTALQQKYVTSRASVIFFDTNLFLLGLLFFLLWRYATHNFRLVDRDEIDPEAIRSGLARNVVVMGVSVLAIGIAFINPNWSTTAYLLLPIFFLWL